MNKTHLVRHLKRVEGFSAFPYDDVGDQSIGFGRNLTQIGITKAEGEVLLLNDIERCEQELRKRYSWFKDLTDIRQTGMLSLNFNLGSTRLAKFKKCLKAMSEGKYGVAAHEVYPHSKYATQVPARAHEISQMLRGEENNTENTETEDA
jgi:lysozyme